MRTLSAQEIVAGRSVESEVHAEEVFARPVTVQLDRVSLKVAIEAIASNVGIRVQYRIPLLDAVHTAVTLHASKLPLGVALDRILSGTNLQAVALDRDLVAIRSIEALTNAARDTVTGFVADAASKRPIAGASVTLDDSSQSTGHKAVHTDREGRFRFTDVPAGVHRLTVRYLGYQVVSQPVTVTDEKVALTTIMLTAASTTLTEVVTTATGQKLRMEVGNTVGTIRADSIVATQQIRNVSDLLQARLPEVFVQNTDGAVGAPSRIRLRGANSVSLNNDPIVIVDGIRINAQTTQASLQTNTGSVTMLPQVTGSPGKGGPPQAALAPSRLDDIDPNTIDKIEVLYGPSASSLYGTDAANGVIVITTKRGHPGVLHATLIGDAGQMQMPGSSPEMWWGWGRFNQFDGVLGATIGTCNLTVGGSAQVTNGTCKQDSVTQYNPQNDPNMQTLGTGTSNSVNGTLSGGTNQVQQFLSMSVANNVGMAKISPAQDRLLTRLYNEALPSWMVRPNTQQEIDVSSMTSLTLSSVLDAWLSALGMYNNVLNGGNGLQSFTTDQNGGAGSGISPTDTLGYLPSESQRTKATSLAKHGTLSTNGTYRPLNWLRMNAQLGGDYSLRTDEALLRAQDCSVVLQGIETPWEGTGCPSQRSVRMGETFVSTANVGATASFVPFSWFMLATAVGEQYTHTNGSSLRVGNSDPYRCQLAFGTTLLTPNPVCSDPNSQQYSVNDSRDASAEAGVYLEETIVFFGTYYTFGVRHDVASGFGSATNKRPPRYPKFNLSIPLSDKSFFPKQPYVSMLRARIAYGQSGNQASQTAVLNNYIGSVFSNTGGSQDVITITQLGNASLRPEKSIEWEGGLDASFFDSDRISTSVTMSRKFTRDLLSSVNLPSSYGMSSIYGQPTQYENLGNVVSRSLGLSLNARLIDRQSINWNLVVGWSQLRNKLVHEASGFAQWGNGAGLRYKEGYPLNSFWATPVVSYKDLNRNGILEQSEITFGPDQFIGGAFPSSTVNYSSNLALWNGALRMSATLSQVNGQVIPLCVSTSCGVYPRAAVDPTTSLSEQAAYIQAVVNGGYYITKSSSVRVNEASVTYTVPPHLIRRFLRAETLDLTLTGRNLGLWTSYAGQDPNVDGSGLIGEASVDGGSSTPQPRSWLLRVNLGF